MYERLEICFEKRNVMSMRKPQFPDIYKKTYFETCKNSVRETSERTSTLPDSITGAAGSQNLILRA